MGDFTQEPCCPGLLPLGGKLAQCRTGKPFHQNSRPQQVTRWPAPLHRRVWLSISLGCARDYRSERISFARWCGE